MTNILPEANELAPDYYWHNFDTLVRWVSDRYADVLPAQTIEFIDAFQAMSHDAQCLLLRMNMRKGEYFRLNKLNYNEISNTEKACQILYDNQLIKLNPLLEPTEYSQLVTKQELWEINLGQSDLSKHNKKSAMQVWLAHHHPEMQSWNTWSGSQLGPLYQLACQPHFDTLLLLFFANPYQDLTEFVLQDLGVQRYESYHIHAQHRPINSPAELADYQQLIAYRQQFEKIIDDSEALYQMATELPVEGLSSSMALRYQRFRNRLGYRLEQLSCLEWALQVYQNASISPSRERQIRILEKQKQFKPAWQLLQLALNDPASEQERQVAQRIAPRLAKRLGQDWQVEQPLRPSQQHLRISRIRNEEGVPHRVEEQVRLSLQQDHAPCEHSENALFCGLFGLWIWPQLYAPVEAAFANPFQLAPLDLYHEDFVARRPGIAHLFALLDKQKHQQHMWHTWNEKQGISNPFVNWQYLTENKLSLALDCIQASVLKAIFSRMLFDLKANRSGFPDLVQFFPDKHSFQLFEVKGPGDKLQDNQIRWLQFFDQQGIDAQVVHVSWLDETS